MDNVFFTPWKGESYAENGFHGKKILVLGESHYCADSGVLDSDFTEEVVKAFLSYTKGEAPHEHWMNTFTHFTKMFLGEPLEKEEILEFWDAIVFYNYVQRAMSQPGVSPSDEDFENSAPAFFEVLKEYKPDLVIAWGNRLWRALPAANGVEGEPVLAGEGGNFYLYTIDGKLIRACGIPHPSRPSSFNGYAYLQAALNKLSTP